MEIRSNRGEQVGCSSWSRNGKRPGFKSQLSNKANGDLKPVTFSQPNLPHKVVVETIVGRRDSCGGRSQMQSKGKMTGSR